MGDKLKGKPASVTAVVLLVISMSEQHASKRYEGVLMMVVETPSNTVFN